MRNYLKELLLNLIKFNLESIYFIVDFIVKIINYFGNFFKLFVFIGL